MNQQEALIMQIAEKLVKSSIKLMTSIMPGGGRIEQAISKVSLLRKTGGYPMSVAQCGQACVVADISPFVGQHRCRKENK